MQGAGPATVSVAEDRLSKESCLGLPELDSTSIDLAKYPALHFGKVAIAVCQLQYFFCLDQAAAQRHLQTSRLRAARIVRQSNELTAFLWFSFDQARLCNALPIRQPLVGDKEIQRAVFELFLSGDG
jgi:hypothetical protein